MQQCKQKHQFETKQNKRRNKNISNNNLSRVKLNPFHKYRALNSSAQILHAQPHQHRALNSSAQILRAQPHQHRDLNSSAQILRAQSHKHRAFNLSAQISRAQPFRTNIVCLTLPHKHLATISSAMISGDGLLVPCGLTHQGFNPLHGSTHSSMTQFPIGSHDCESNLCGCHTTV